MLVGGLRHGIQTFSQKIAGSNAALLVVAAVGLFVPAVFALTTSEPDTGTLTEESVLVSIALMVGYALSLVYQFTNPAARWAATASPADHAGPAWSGRMAVVVLLIAAALLAVLSEILVGSITGSSSSST